MFAYRLAVMSGSVNVKQMLQQLTASQFLEWQEYAALEPFGALRDNYHTAIVAKALMDIAQAKTQDGKPFSIDDFMVRRRAVRQKPQQTWQMKKMLAHAIATAFSVPAKEL